MQLRTDLALEAREFVDEKEEGVVVKEEEQDGIKISEIKILNQKAAKKMNKGAFHFEAPFSMRRR